MKDPGCRRLSPRDSTGPVPLERIPSNQMVCAHEAMESLLLESSDQLLLELVLINDVGKNDLALLGNALDEVSKIAADDEEVSHLRGDVRGGGVTNGDVALAELLEDALDVHLDHKAGAKARATSAHNAADFHVSSFHIAVDRKANRLLAVRGCPRITDITQLRGRSRSPDPATGK